VQVVRTSSAGAVQAGGVQEVTLAYSVTYRHDAAGLYSNQAFARVMQRTRAYVANKGAADTSAPEGSCCIIGIVDAAVSPGLRAVQLLLCAWAGSAAARLPSP
jgi:hypothetical protein